jgi:hypothetical protein
MTSTNNNLIILEDVSINGFFNPPAIEEFDKKTVDMERVNLAIECLEICIYPVFSLNRKKSSYGIKHLVERYIPGGYLSNGELIIAMVNLGFKYKKLSTRSPNCYFNISAKSIRNLENNTYGLEIYR